MPWFSNDFLLEDTIDVQNRVIKASKQMGALHFIWDAKESPIQAKVKLHQTIPQNLVLWDIENWRGNKADISIFEVFRHKSIRRTLGISIVRSKDERLKNEDDM